MLTHVQTQIAFALAQFRQTPMSKPVKHNRAVFAMDRKTIVGQNIGTVVRPEIIRVDPSTKTETVEMFLARGGSIKRGPASMKGYKSPCVKTNTTRFSVSRG